MNTQYYEQELAAVALRVDEVARTVERIPNSPAYKNEVMMEVEKVHGRLDDLTTTLDDITAKMEQVEAAVEELAHSQN